MPVYLNKIKKYIFSTWERKILAISLVFFLVFSLGIRVFAIYLPGATLSPSCAPGASGCTVEILPGQTGNSGLYLTTDGAGNTSWAAAASGGLTSLNGLTGGIQDFDFGTTDLTISSSGTTHSFSWSSALRTDNGGTGLSGMGSPNELLGMNPAGDALEYKSFAIGTANTDNDLNLSYSGAQIFFNVPDASANDRGVVTTGAQTLAGQKTFSLLPLISPNANPTLDGHLTTKSYVDTFASGLSVRQSVRVATVTALTLASDFENGDTVDGVVLATNDRILIKDQAAGATNGIYTVNASGAPTRATDYDIDAEVVTGTFTSVTAGTNANTQWVLVTPATITLGATALTFSQLSAQQSYTAGSGLSLSALAFSLDMTNANTWTGQQTFNTLSPIVGTLTAGSVVFAGASKELSQDNSNFFWDDSNNRLGVGTTTPGAPVHIAKAVTGTMALLKLEDLESTTRAGTVIIREGTNSVDHFSPVLDFTVGAGTSQSYIATHADATDDTYSNGTMMSFRTALTDGTRVLNRDLFSWSNGDSGSSQVRMKMDRSGFLGISNSTPTGPLSVHLGSVLGPGTIATANSVVVTGTGTYFTSTFKPGDVVNIGGNSRTVASIQSDTSMTLTVAITSTASGLTYIVTGGDRFGVGGNGNLYNMGSFFGTQNTTLNNLLLGSGSGNLNMTATGTTLVGINAGTALTSGIDNTFIGKGSGNANTTGTLNTFVGKDSGLVNTSGIKNTFVGMSAGSANTTGQENSFFGRAAGFYNTTGSYNTFIGEEAGVNVTTGGRNTMVGYAPGNASTTGYGNNFFGNIAGNSTTTGNYNLLFGNKAGNANTTGSNNIQIGTLTQEAGSTATLGSTILIGNRSVATASHQLVIGSNNPLGNVNDGYFGSGVTSALTSINTVDTSATLGITAGGTYSSTGDAVFVITIATLGTSDTFNWVETGGSAGSASGVSITGGAQTLADGVTVTFASTTGHVVGQTYEIGATDQRDFTMNASGGSGSDVIGANLIFAGGKATGNAVGGSLIFKTSDAGSTGSTLQSLTEKMRLTAGGLLGLGTSSPLGVLDIRGKTTSSGAITMSASSGASTFTTSSSVTLVAGDVIIPTTTTTQARTVSVGGTGTSFTVSLPFSAAVSTQTYTVNPPMFYSQNSSSSPLLTIGQIGVGIGTVSPDASLTLAGSTGGSFSFYRSDDNDGGTARWRQVVSGGGASILRRNRLFFQSDTGSGYVSNFMMTPEGNFSIGHSDTTTLPVGLLEVMQPTTGTGTVSNSAGGTTVTGVRTQFTNTFKVGDTVTIGGETVAISAIASDTSMTTATITGANSGVTYTLTGGNRFTVQGNGLVGIGTATPSYRLHVSDTATAGIVGAFTNSDGTCTLDPGDVGGWSCPSDINLKKNITSIDTALGEINRLRPVSYLFKNENEDAKFANGLIAQEVQEVFPGLVKTQIDGTLSLNYVGLTPFMIKAIQELDIKLQNISGLTSGGGGSVVDQLVGAIVNMKELIVEKLTIGSSAKPTAITVYDKNGNAGCMTIEDVNTGATKITPGVCTDAVTPASVPTPSAPVDGGSTTTPTDATSSTTTPDTSTPAPVDNSVPPADVSTTPPADAPVVPPADPAPAPVDAPVTP